MVSCVVKMRANSPLRFDSVIAWMASAACVSPSGPTRSNVQVNLESRLRDAGIDTLVICGATTNHCVETVPMKALLTRLTITGSPACSRASSLTA